MGLGSETAALTPAPSPCRGVGRVGVLVGRGEGSVLMAISLVSAGWGRW